MKYEYFYSILILKYKILIYFELNVIGQLMTEKKHETSLLR